MDSSYETSGRSSSTSAELSKETSDSVFLDCACGEPLVEQHLVVDFTPSKMDTDFVQEKCIAFWDLVSNSPELQGLVVLPKGVKSSKLNECRQISKPVDSASMSETVSCEEFKAISILSNAEKKGLIGCSLKAAVPRTTCSVGSRHYPDGEASNATLASSHPCGTKHVCDCKKIECQSRKQHQSGDTLSSPSSHKPKSIYKEMRDWDNKHLKPMDPPGHPPSVIHSVMKQKTIF